MNSEPFSHQLLDLLTAQVNTLQDGLISMADLLTKVATAGEKQAINIKAVATMVLDLEKRVAKLEALMTHDKPESKDESPTDQSSR